jgi:PKD repeat protein
LAVRRFMMKTVKRLMKAIVSMIVCLTMLGGMVVLSPNGSAALPPTDATIVGNVSDSFGPIPNTYVKAMINAPNMGSLEVNYSFTDSSGDYSLGVPGGFDYTVFAVNGDYYLAMTSASVVSGGTAYANITLTPVAPMPKDVTVHGFVKDELGNPVSSGHVLGVVNNPMGGDGAPIYGNLTVPDVTGYFEITTIAGPAGGGAIAMDFLGLSMIENTTSDPLVSGQTYWFNITLTMPVYNDDAAVHGMVIGGSTGLPLVGVMVSFQSWNPYSPDNYQNYTFTNLFGMYQMDVRNGTAQMMFSKAGYSMFLVQNLDVPSGASILQDATLLAMEAVIQGNVTDLSTGLGISSANVFVFDSSGAFTYTTTNSTGGYVMQTIAGTDLTVFAQKDGYSQNFTTMFISPGDEKWQDFGLWPKDSWLTGYVTDYISGMPIQNAWVNAEGGPSPGSANTDASGYYNITLARGTYSVSVNAMNYIQSRSTVDVVAKVETVHDVALIPWNPPHTTRLYGWVNTSGTTDPIVGAQVRVAMPDLNNQNSTGTNSTGYYEMWIAPLPLVYMCIANNHGMVNGDIDATGMTELQLNLELPEDTSGPVLAYSQAPTENISWTNPTNIHAEATDDFMMQLTLFQFMYWKTSSGWEYYYTVMANVTSFDPWSSQNNLPYSQVGSTYTVDASWDGLTTGGWLGNLTGYSYLPAYKIVAGGTDTYYAIRGAYYNSSFPMGMSGTALFDSSTNAFAMFMPDGGGSGPAMPDDTSGQFEPYVLMLQVMESNPTNWWWGGNVPLGMWSIDGLEFIYDEAVPSGDYKTLFSANDWGQHGDMRLTNLTIDNEPPVANAGTDIIAVVNTSVAFDASGSTDNVGIVNYTWEYVDGYGATVTLYDQVVSQVFNLTGDYAVTLSVSDAAGHVVSDSVWVNVTADEPPVANAGPDQTVDEGIQVIFDGSGSHDDVGIANCTWTISDLGVELYDVSPAYTFTTPGMYTVELVVTDTIGQTSMPDSMTVTVNDTTPPTANAGPDQSVALGSAVTFDGSGSTDNVGVVNYTWTFTDGSAVTLYGMTKQYMFTTLGAHTVTLTVRDAAGLTDTDTVVITVSDMTDPVAHAGPDQIVPIGTTVRFDGSASTDNVGITSYTWTFTDINSRTLTGATPSYQFNHAGQYIVTLTVADAAGNTNIDTVVVTVEDQTNPVANAGPDQSVNEGVTVTFDGSDSTDNVGVDNLTWTFTDAGMQITLYGEYPTYVFTSSGTFVVTLTVKDAAGNSDTDSVTIRVNGPPIASAGSDQTVNAGDSVTFNGSASTDDGGAVNLNYTWLINVSGTQVVRYGAVFDYTFDKAGTYTATLAVRDAGGLTSTDQVTTTVQEKAKSFVDSYWWLFVVLAVVVVALALFMLMQRGKGGKPVKKTSSEGSQTEDEDPGPPENDEL